MTSRHDHRPTGHDQDGLGNSEFTRLAEFVQGYSGIRMPPIKKTLMEGRLRRRVKALGMSDLAEYCRYLFDEGGLDAEADFVIDVVTTNKTDFFREAQHFHFLANRALPSLLGEREEGHLTAWSAASSIGAEAYTIAIVLSEFAKAHRGVDFTIYATDICNDVLRHGARAVYSEDDIAPVPGPQQSDYFMRAKDSGRREVRVVPALREKVRFARLNLMDSRYAMPMDMDVIFCRNVLIYFERDIQRQVLSRLCRHLHPGGYLFVGHSESLAGQNLPLAQVGNAVFVRIK